MLISSFEGESKRGGQTIGIIHNTDTPILTPRLPPSSSLPETPAEMGEKKVESREGSLS